MSKHINGKIWLSYIAFVVYGSLVPLDYHSVPFDDAFARFLKIPMLDLGVDSRADWIANGVLYFPVGFLTAQYIRQFGLSLLVIFSLSFIFSGCLAIGVEFTQLFFPPRTVSLNDLVAEIIGSFLGVCSTAYASTWYNSLLKSLFGRIDLLHKYLLEGYAVFYISYSLFPYDFLIHGQEIQQKINGDQWGWLVATDVWNEEFYLNFARLGLEVFMSIPMGIAIMRMASGRISIVGAALAGIVLGITIELLQFFMATGISQGISVAARCVGFVIGARFYNEKELWSFKRIRELIRASKLFIVGFYFLVLASITGWFSQPWGALDQALAKLFNDTQFLPFYYHYFTTEAIALQSLASIAFLYAPVGILCWALRKQPILAGWFAIIFASIMEISKLFLVGKHADPTNLLIAFSINYMLVRLLSLTEGYGLNGQLRKQEIIKPAVAFSSLRYSIETNLVILMAGSALLLYWSFHFPVFNTDLLFVSFAYCGLIWYRPALIFCFIPAALPLLDFAPWSGRFFFDEFDVLVLCSLVIGFLRSSHAQYSIKLTPVIVLCLGLIAISFLISTILGLLPWQPIDSNSWANYLSNYNALRISRGVLWFYPLFFLAKRQIENGTNVGWAFRQGLNIGLWGTVIFILIERLLFTGLFDFSNEHRVVGPFSAIHVGGAYVECFLVICVPFLLKEISQARRTLVLVLNALLLVLTAYAVMVTFSRGGYLAFAISLLLYAIFEIFKKEHGKKSSRPLTIAIVMVMAIFTAVPVLFGKFAQDRLSTIEFDFETRLKHWGNTIDMMKGSWVNQIFGMGVGKYPITYYWAGYEDDQSGSYRIFNDTEKSYIRLGVGRGLYIDQTIPSQHGMPLTVSFVARAKSVKSQIVFSICQKWLLASNNCSWQASVINQADVWVQQQIRLSPSQSGSAAELPLVPYFFSINNPSQAVIDITEIRLISQYGENLISNGFFENGMDHWFFQADKHLSWHAKNLFLAIFFDQGVFGLLVFVALFSLTLIWTMRTGEEDWAIALVAFIVVGLFDTLIDTPRFVLLLMILLSFPFILKSLSNAKTNRSQNQQRKSVNFDEDINKQKW